MKAKVTACREKIFFSAKIQTVKIGTERRTIVLWLILNLLPLKFTTLYNAKFTASNQKKMNSNKRKEECIKWLISV